MQQRLGALAADPGKVGARPAAHLPAAMATGAELEEHALTPLLVAVELQRRPQRGERFRTRDHAGVVEQVRGPPPHVRVRRTQQKAAPLENEVHLAEPDAPTLERVEKDAVPASSPDQVAARIPPGRRSEVGPTPDQVGRNRPLLGGGKFRHGGSLHRLGLTGLEQRAHPLQPRAA